MNRIKSTVVVLLILCFTLVSFSQFEIVKSAEQVFIEDNFESYPVGIFPSVDGWRLWFNGAGTDQQTIVNDVFNSSTKSLHLLGVDEKLVGYPWAATAAIIFDSASSKIGFEVSVMVEKTTGGTRDSARVAFSKIFSEFISHDYAPVFFLDDGNIISGNQVLQSYIAKTWYKVKLVMDRTNGTYSVWIDNMLRGENLSISTNTGESYPTSEIEAFSLNQCYNGISVYFDDVKVFSVYDANPLLELEPASGIASTTLVGSGFAPLSKITVTWNGIKMHSVPEPLITDSNGNFTAIITVLNQTETGLYSVSVSDEMENKATNTFTVIPEFPSWSILVFGLSIVFILSIIFRQRIKKGRKT
jgi:hypothetical protein